MFKKSRVTKVVAQINQHIIQINNQRGELDHSLAGHVGCGRTSMHSCSSLEL